MIPTRVHATDALFFKKTKHYNLQFMLPKGVAHSFCRWIDWLPFLFRAGRTDCDGHHGACHAHNVLQKGDCVEVGAWNHPDETEAAGQTQER
jgi:hypothetical protein